MKNIFIRNLLIFLGLLLLSSCDLSGPEKPSKLLDKSFGNSGFTTTGIANNPHNADLIIDNKGRIWQLGYTVIKQNSSQIKNSETLLLRYTADGKLDKGFASNGKKLLSTNGSNIKAFAMAIDKNYRIVLTGEKGGRFFLTRLLANGDLDTSFANQGYVNNLSDGTRTYSSAVFAFVNNDGTIYIVAVGSIAYKSFASLVKFKPNGVVDSSFGTNGFVSVDGFADARVDKQGRIVILLDEKGNLTVKRFSSDGLNDDSFKETSLNRVTIDRLTVRYRGASLTIDKSNRIVVLGEKVEDRSLPYYPQDQTIILRLLENGLIDSSFGEKGQVTLKFGTKHSNWLGSTYEYMSDIALDSSGRIIVVGSNNIIDLTAQNVGNIAIARILDTGKIDLEFGINGITEISSRDRTSVNNAVVGIDWDGKVIIAAGTTRSFFVARFLP